MYIGSHTWDGPEGVLDPNYQGSSGLAKRHGWTPIKQMMLESVSDTRKLVAEREWIEKYANIYGIADCAYFASKSKIWINKFPKHGKLLNMHANSCVGIQKIGVELARAKDVRRRATETWIHNGCLGLEHAVRAAHTPEAVKKCHDAIRARAPKYKVDDSFVGTTGEIAEKFKLNPTTSSGICHKADYNEYVPKKGVMKGHRIMRLKF